MSFVTNEYQQISLFDSLGFLSPRKQRILEKSWAKPFSDHIFSNIDEMIFAPLYSEKANSRPNAPVNVIVGALILKELNGLTDDEILEECECDFRYQYALHTTSYENQPISDRTFSRFRERNAAYELVTGKDLIHDCIVGLSEHIRQFMGIGLGIKRMDSMMIEANIKKMGRLELLYTCLSNLVKAISRDGELTLPEGFGAYADPNNRNKVVYYAKDIPQEQRLQKVIDDAVTLLPLCRERYVETTDYQLLVRAVSGQTKDGGDGRRIPKGKGDGMTASVLQNPSDPDATYRDKANKPHRGYSANLTEAVSEKGSVVIDYQYDVNTKSDSSFLQDYIREQDEEQAASVLITDGAYSGGDNQASAAGKNITLLTTGLIGRKPQKILSEFRLNEEETAVLSCPAGHAPKSCSYIRQSETFRVSFHCADCLNCPRRDECSPAVKERTAVKFISLKSRRKLGSNILDEETRTLIGRIRNGVETVPSVIRNKYGVDKMPVHGKLRTKQFFGFKVAALNFTKLVRSLKGKEKCRALLPA